MPELEAEPPNLPRLTQAQYHNVLRDLFTSEVLVPASLEPDLEAAGLLQVGASLGTVSPWGVEQYEAAAFQIARQVLESESLRAAWLDCTPAATTDEACARSFLDAVGRKAWRRPLEAGELDGLAALSASAAATMGDFYVGLQYGLAALLQSPHFLYRVELGEDDPGAPGQRQYTSSEVATRLSFFLWNTLPDDELFAAAEAGELLTDAGLAEQVDRMLADDRTREGVRNFFSEMLGLYALDDLNKDPSVFLDMSSEVGPSAREQTLLDLERIVFTDDADWRDFFTNQRTFVDRKLAAIYRVPAPVQEGFGEVELPESGRRRGFLGQVSFLAPNAHPTSSSVTLRGKFIREKVLCDDIPTPPSDLNTAIPEPSEDAPTMRDRVAVHLQDEFCASCHVVMDPIGLGVENFDGLGLYRTTENGATIDPASDLDGVAFADAWDLGRVLRDHASVGPCLTETLFRYVTGHVKEGGEYPLIDWHAQEFAASGHRVKALLRDLALSPALRRAGAIE